MTAQVMFTEDEYNHYMYLLKILFRLHVIDTNEALRLALAFQQLFV